MARSETDRKRLSQDNVEDKDRIEEKLRREQAARKQQIARLASATEKGIYTSERQQMTCQTQQMTCQTEQLKSENTDGGEVFSMRRFRVLIHDVLDVTIVATVLRKSPANFWKCAATD